jgi:hypothetical protein
VASGDVDVPFECPDQATYERALAASACAVDAIEHSGEERVRAALCEAGAPFRRPDGSYRLENRLRYVIARRWSSPPGAPSTASRRLARKPICELFEVGEQLAGDDAVKQGHANPPRSFRIDLVTRP